MYAAYRKNKMNTVFTVKITKKILSIYLRLKAHRRCLKEGKRRIYSHQMYQLILIKYALKRMYVRLFKCFIASQHLKKNILMKMLVEIRKILLIIIIKEIGFTF